MVLHSLKKRRIWTTFKIREIEVEVRNQNKEDFEAKFKGMMKFWEKLRRAARSVSLKFYKITERGLKRFLLKFNVGEGLIVGE